VDFPRFVVANEKAEANIIEIKNPVSVMYKIPVLPPDIIEEIISNDAISENTTRIMDDFTLVIVYPPRSLPII
jgi:hypothetical protein